MSYLSTKRRRAPRAMAGLDDLFNEIADALWNKNTQGGTKTETSACLAQANAQTAQLDAKTSDLSKNWNPTGFYSATQVTQLVNGTLDILNRAVVAIGQTQADDTLGDSSTLKSFADNVQRKMAAASAYQAAVRTATDAGQAAINAPGLKDWVVKSMIDASAAMNAAYVVACLRPWWAGVFNLFASAFDALWKLAKAIVGVIVDVGTTVVKVATGLASLPSWLLFAGAAAGGYALYRASRR